ncbi:uncharacterized protein LOC142574355 isoform X3 [Dermacentor variabilis]|uniref:uncharacterized protein LOC142574355 isoform X3 n=1 Tax=Dermacentor variabilis TaxID=34621 RepID=UPI003F5B3407
MVLKLLCLVFCAFMASPLYGTSPYQPNDRDVIATIDEYRNVMCQRHGYTASRNPPKLCELCGTCENGTCQISPDCKS